MGFAKTKIVSSNAFFSSHGRNYSIFIPKLFQLLRTLTRLQFFISASLKFFRGLMDSFAQVWMCFSVLMIVALTFERHFAIRSPHRVSIQIINYILHSFPSISKRNMILYLLMYLVKVSNSVITIQYRIHIRTTAWWKHLAYYVVPVTLLSLFFNVPMFINLQVYTYIHIYYIPRQQPVGTQYIPKYIGSSILGEFNNHVNKMRWAGG